MTREDRNTFIKVGAVILAIILIVAGISYCEDRRVEEALEEYGKAGVAYDMGDTVYVSNAGKIHDNPNCSGMIHYKSMSLEKALSKGYSLCQNCY